MDAKLTKLTQHMAKEEWEKALKIAGKFYDLGEHKEVIMLAYQAITNERFHKQIGKDPEKSIEAGIQALKERYPDYLDYGDIIKQTTTKRKEAIKKKEAKRKTALAKGDEIGIAELEHGVFGWGRILVRSGFVFEKKGKSFDLSSEKESNIAFLGKILEEIGEKKALKSKIFTPLSLTIDQPKWLQAVDKIATGTDEGSCDDLAIMDAYISGIVRWVNEIGIPTELSCDGHGKKNPSVTLKNKRDAAILDAILVLLSDSAWRFENPHFKYPRQPGRGISKKRPLFHRGWLLDVAEKLHEKKHGLRPLVVAMRRLKSI
jgi:hypothetical protein